MQIQTTVGKALLMATEELRVGSFSRADGVLDQVLVAEPDNPEALHLRGVSALMQRNYGVAIDFVTRAIARKPQDPTFHCNLANALMCRGEFQASADACQKALSIDPEMHEAYNSLGNALRVLRQFDPAEDAFRAAIRLSPKNADAVFNLGSLLFGLGETEEGLQLAERAIAMRPDFAMWQSVRLFMLHYRPNVNSRMLLEAHTQWRNRFVKPLKKKTRPTTVVKTSRKLRIGYVSADWRVHSIARLMLPILSEHDRSRFEIICFSDVSHPDSVTDRFRSVSDEWHTITNLDDATAATAIREKRIDILVDLSLHASGNRMLTFALKPATIQVSYLAYASTSGLKAIDFRLSDRFIDPIGSSEVEYSESTFRLSQNYWCYAAPEFSPHGYSQVRCGS